MKISHEIPKQLFPINGLINDYPYVLGHLLPKDEEYAKFYKEQLVKAEYSILDNSAFELGASINPETLYKLALEYKPKVLVLPDTLHDMKKTIKDSKDFYSRHGHSLNALGIKCMGVLQGSTFEELLSCWREYQSLGLEYIALPFDCIKDSNWNTIRIQIWQKLLPIAKKGKWCRYHFLGIQNPSELLCYTKEELESIYSIDTSSPILNGVEGNSFNDFGMVGEKPKLKLADNLNMKIEDLQVENIIHNVKKFKQYAER